MMNQAHCYSSETRRQRITDNRRSILCILSWLLIQPLTGYALFSKVEGIEDARIRRVAVSESNPSLLAVASDNALYVSTDGGDHFTKDFTLKGENTSHLHIAAGHSNLLYVAGTRNCYAIGQTPKRIFTADENETINYITRSGRKVYIGTSQGLYIGEEPLYSWQRVPGLRKGSVYSMEPHGGDLYLASDAGVYALRPDGALDRLFITRNNQENGGLRIGAVRADSMTPGRLWLGSNRGIFCSTDAGETWQRFFIAGIGSASINLLAQPPMNADSLFVCSNSGLFRIDLASGRSTPLFEGIPTSKIRWMDFTPDGHIYLATDQGLFTNAREAEAPGRHTGNLNNLMEGEPSIQQVQEAALRYNSVHPDKTADWKKRVKYRALMPRLSVDYDKTIGSSFTSSGYYYAQGPYDWGIALTWDLDELIWNSYEDDIDNRTKLTTQLRLDILDEVNRLYFERLRLKHEISKAAPQSENAFLQRLRLTELTATLDGYTGGLYSQRAEPRATRASRSN